MLKALIATVLFCTTLNLATPNKIEDSTVTYVNYVTVVNPKVTQTDAKQIVKAAFIFGNQRNIDPVLILAVTKVESTFKTNALSHMDAHGLMQVVPKWHKERIRYALKKFVGSKLTDINTNIYLGSGILRDCMDRTTSINKALLCYSGQTAGYDHKVLAVYNKLRNL